MKKRLLHLWRIGIALIALSISSCSHTPERKEQSISDEIGEDMIALYPNYKEKRSTLKLELAAQEKLLFEAEKRGEEITCASQIFNEALWMLGYLADLNRAEKRISDLKTELALAPKARLTDEQSAKDGSWGRCFEEWFFKLTISGDHVLDLAERGKSPKFALKFLDRVNSPEQLKAYLNAILVSDVASTGRLNRRELNESVSTLIRLIIKNPPKDYNFHPQLKTTLSEFIHQHWQNPTTGYWGAWFQRKDGRVEKTTDLSITFHIVSYLKGRVAHLDRIFDTTLKIRDQQYPLGWKDEGNYENHHNYDVVRLLRSGWSHATGDARKIARDEIAKMLDWCLKHSLQPDGSFRVSNSDDSLEDSYYFGVSFLDEVGFFDEGKRFWTDEKLPDSKSIRERLISQIQKLSRAGGGKSGVYYRSALEKLGSK